MATDDRTEAELLEDFERDFREVLLPAPPVEGLMRPHRGSGDAGGQP